MFFKVPLKVNPSQNSWRLIMPQQLSHSLLPIPIPATFFAVPIAGWYFSAILNVSTTRSKAQLNLDLQNKNSSILIILKSLLNVSVELYLVLFGKMYKCYMLYLYIKCDVKYPCPILMACVCIKLLKARKSTWMRKSPSILIPLYDLWASSCKNSQDSSFFNLNTVQRL